MAKARLLTHFALVACILLILTSGCSKREASLPQGPQGAAPTATQQPATQPPADQDAAVAPEPAGTQGTQIAAGGGKASTSSGNGFADWPAFRGPKATGIAPGKGINKDWAKRPPKVLWQCSMGDKGYAGPSVADGKVFIIDHRGADEVLKALDLQTGQPLWEFGYKDTDQFNYGYGRSTPTVAGGNVYIQSRLGLVQCVKANGSGNTWSRDLVAEFGGQRPQWDYAASPLVDDNKVIVCPGGKTGLAALDAASGKTLWTGGVGGAPGYATPAKATLNGKAQYIVFAGTCVYGADAASGKTLWQVPWKTQYDVNAAAPVNVDGWVFVTSGYNTGCGLIEVKAGGAKVYWTSKEIQSHFNTPVYFGGYLYGISDPGNLVCLSPKDGKAMWKQPGFEKGGVALVDGCLIAVAGDSGDAVLVNAVSTGYGELGRIKPLGGQSWSPPVIAQGKLLVRNTEGLACVDLM